MAAKGSVSDKPPQQPSVQLENRFAPLLQDAGCPSFSLGEIPPSHSRIRTESTSKNERLQGKLKPKPQTLIVGNIAVKHENYVLQKHQSPLLSKRHSVWPGGKIPAYCGFTSDCEKYCAAHWVKWCCKAAVWSVKTGFLLNTVSFVKAEVFISGPLPLVRRGDERFIRLRALNRWLSTACAACSMHLIDNFNIFWECRHLFKPNRTCLNKPGVKFFASKLFYFLHHPSVPSAKDKRQEKSAQEEDTAQHDKSLEEKTPLPPLEENSDHTTHQN